MRNYLVIAFLLLAPKYICYSQETDQNTKIGVGLVLSPIGWYNISNLVHEESDPKYSYNSYYSIGLGGYFQYTKELSFETSIIYSKYKINLDANGSDYYTSMIENITLISIPLNLTVASKHVFLTNGILFDFELKNSGYIQNKTGIGYNLGLGAKFDLPSGLFISVGIYGNVHSIIPFKALNTGETLSGVEAKFGLRYWF